MTFKEMADELYDVSVNAYDMSDTVPKSWFYLIDLLEDINCFSLPFRKTIKEEIKLQYNKMIEEYEIIEETVTPKPYTVTPDPYISCSIKKKKKSK